MGEKEKKGIIIVTIKENLKMKMMIVEQQCMAMVGEVWMLGRRSLVHDPVRADPPPVRCRWPW